MHIHSLRNAGRPGGSHRRAPSAGIVRIRVLRGILVLVLALAAGLGAAVLTLPGHGGSRPAQVSARQHHGSHAHPAIFTAVTAAKPKPFMW
jgi:hypothetical protein